MRFEVAKEPYNVRKGETIWTYDHWPVRVIGEFGCGRTVAVFIGSDRIGEISKDIAPLLAGDYCDFLNDKYCDKDFNQEWGEIDREARIKYHEEQIKILKGGNCRWNRHGNGVKL